MLSLTMMGLIVEMEDPPVDEVVFDPFRLDMEVLFCDVTTVVEFITVIVDEPLPFTVVQFP